MKDRISALMDGELDERAASDTLQQVGRDGEAAAAWRTYHLIGDVLRDDRVLTPGFAARVGERLAAEPTVLAPAAAPGRARRWLPLPAAAVAAAIALVSWVAFAPQREQPAVAPAPVAEAKPVMVAPSIAANDYLLAHQGFSPRVAFQGMAPYVRTVSEQVGPAGEDRK
jgi:sigma-E factor negative regulatory protein RseA